MAIKYSKEQLLAVESSNLSQCPKLLNDVKIEVDQRGSRLILAGAELGNEKELLSFRDHTEYDKKYHVSRNEHSFRPRHPSFGNGTHRPFHRHTGRPEDLTATIDNSSSCWGRKSLRRNMNEQNSALMANDGFQRKNIDVFQGTPGVGNDFSAFANMGISPPGGAFMGQKSISEFEAWKASMRKQNQPAKSRDSDRPIVLRSVFMDDEGTEKGALEHPNVLPKENVEHKRNDQMFVNSKTSSHSKFRKFFDNAEDLPDSDDYSEQQPIDEKELDSDAKDFNRVMEMLKSQSKKKKSSNSQSEITNSNQIYAAVPKDKMQNRDANDEFFRSLLSTSKIKEKAKKGSLNDQLKASIPTSVFKNSSYPRSEAPQSQALNQNVPIASQQNRPSLHQGLSSSFRPPPGLGADSTKTNSSKGSNINAGNVARNAYGFKSTVGEINMHGAKVPPPPGLGIQPSRNTKLS